MIRYSRVCGSYQDFIDRGLLLTKATEPRILMVKLKSSLRKFCGRHHDLVNRYGTSVSQITTICSTCREHFPVISSFITYHRVCNQSNTTGATNGAGTAHHSGAHDFTPVFQWCSCYSIFSFMCNVCRSLFVLLTFFVWPLCCLSFDLRILITPLVSSNSFSNLFG